VVRTTQEPVVATATNVALRGQWIAPPQIAEPDAMRLWRALRRRWMLVLGLGSVLAAAAGAAAWLVLAPKYTAYALVHVAANPPRLVGGRDPSDGRSDFATYQRLQAARIKSRYVLNAAMNRPEVKKLDLLNREPEPLPWLDDQIKVDWKEGSELIHVSMIGPDADEVLTLVNAVTKSYLQEIVNVEAKRRADDASEMERIYNEASEKLRQKKETLQRLGHQLGTSDTQALTQKQVTMLANFGEVKKQHIQVQYELMKAEGRLKTAKARTKTAAAQPLTDSMIDKALENDVIAKDYYKRLSDLKEIIRHYRMNAVRGDEAGMLRAQRQERALKDDLAARRKELAAELEAHVARTSQVESEVNLSGLEDEVAALREQEKALKLEVDKASKELEKIGGSSTEIEMLRVEIGLEQKQAERIWDKQEALKYDQRAPERVTLFQEAVLQKRDRRRQFLAAGLAPLGIFFCVGLCVSWLESRNRRIQNVNEVTVLGMKLMGALPPLPAAAVRHRLVAGGDEHKFYGPTFLESVDAIRTLLLRDANREGTRVLMVTSAVEGEAKTTLASHLANSLARAGRKTVLVDCDLRRPTLQDVFDVPLQPGFSEALLGEANVAQAVRETPGGLYVLPAGQWDREVLRVLAKDGAQRLFDQLKNDFDFVVIDSHPVLAATDSLLIGQHADAVLFSLLRDRSQIHVVCAACERLASLGIRVLGAVVNGIDHDALFDEFSNALPRYPRT
jgi:capsular exopolysaccharide synthesis family protein